MDEEIGRIKMGDNVDLVVRKTEYKNQLRVDIRKFVKTKSYEGWSQQGISIPFENWNEVFEIFKKVQ